MKNRLMQLIALFGLFSLISCGGGGAGGDNGGGGGGGKSSCATKNEVTTVKYDDAVQEFKQEYVYANYNKTYNSYRVLYLNYPKAEDNDSGKKAAGQKRIVVGIFNPVDGKFSPGKYTLGGDANGMNKAVVQVETDAGLKMCNTANSEDNGFIEILDVSDTHICGKYNLKGIGFELVGEFNAKHEAVQ